MISEPWRQLPLLGLVMVQASQASLPVLCASGYVHGVDVCLFVCVLHV